MRKAMILLVAAALTLAACGNAAEKAAEEVVGAQAGGEVDIQNDSVSIETDEGEASVEVSGDDETIVVTGTDESGDEVTIEMGGTELPADFPMPVFTPSEVTHVSTWTDADQASYSVTLEIDPADAADAIAFYKAWFDGEGMTVTSSDTTVIGESDAVTSIVQVTEYGSYSEVVLTWTPN